MASRIVIVGAGPAGITVAEALREHDREVEITMLSSEPFPPYAPPAMADHFLTGREDTLFWKGRDICDRLNVEYRANTRVKSLAPQARELSLADGSVLNYDRLVIATGGGLYAPIAGHDLRGVYNFKSLSAAKQLVDRVRADRIRRAVIVGVGQARRRPGVDMAEQDWKPIELLEPPAPAEAAAGCWLARRSGSTVRTWVCDPLMCPSSDDSIWSSSTKPR